MQSLASQGIARGFFLILSAVVLYLFWRLMEPYALVLLTATIAAVILAPADRFLAHLIRPNRLRVGALVLFVFLVVFVPLLLGAIMTGRQAAELIQDTGSLSAWAARLSPENSPLLAYLPGDFRTALTSFDLAGTAKSIAGWTFENAGQIFSSTARFTMQTIIFFIALFYLLADRERLYNAVLDVSPFRNETDRKIIHRLIQTVRQVLFGAVIVAIVKGVLGTLGLTLFGVPGSFLLGTLIVIASQIPLVGTGLVLLPAVIYLFLSGETNSAIGLTIWSVLIVGLVDNLLSPFLLEGKTHMHGLFILLSILGGLQVFGWIGFIAGPTILAGLMVLLELYKSGILEAKSA